MPHLRVFLVLFLVFGLLSCRDVREITQPELIDPKSNLTRKDYEDGFKDGRAAEEKANNAKSTMPPVPQISDVIMPPPDIPNDRVVTLSVTENVPIRDVFVELARKADLDLQIDQDITGGVIFRAKDRPVAEVIERIADQANLRYSVNNGILKVAKDAPYVVNYPVDFMNLLRSNKGEVNVNTQVLSGSTPSGGSGASSSGGAASSGSSSGSGQGLSTGSKSQLKSEYEGDLWKSIEDSVKSIVIPGNRSTPGLAAGAAATNAEAFVSLNKQAGVITVMANDKKHKEVKKYLEHVKASQSSQVLIEAKVLEVNLNSQYRNGINWGLTFTEPFNGIAGFGSAVTEADIPSITRTTINGVTTATLSSSQVAAFGAVSEKLFGLSNTTLDAVVDFTEKFGVTKTLSSPRINALNNQQAVLTFAENFVYFTVSLEEEDNGVGTERQNRVNVSSTINTVPIGVILNLQPSINLEKNEVTINIRPTLSRISGFVADPGVTIIAQRNGSNVSSNIPIVEVRELDSILKIKSGQIMVIGGLMQHISRNNDSGLPGLSTLPVAGNLFKTKDTEDETIETVILIKATIIPGDGKLIEDDKVFYNKYGNDWRAKSFLNQ